MVTKLRIHNCTALGAVLCFVLCACFFPANANAACASKPSKGPFNSSSLFATSGELRSVEPLQQPAAEVREMDDGPASIVGLWSVTFFVGRSSSVWDQGFEQFHSDGTELNNDNSVPPLHHDRIIRCTRSRRNLCNRLMNAEIPKS
jgi:hypothetical protein